MITVYNYPTSDHYLLIRLIWRDVTADVGQPFDLPVEQVLTSRRSKLKRGGTCTCIYILYNLAVEAGFYAGRVVSSSTKLNKIQHVQQLSIIWIGDRLMFHYLFVPIVLATPWLLRMDSVNDPANATLVFEHDTSKQL